MSIYQDKPIPNDDTSIHNNTSVKAAASFQHHGNWPNKLIQENDHILYYIVNGYCQFEVNNTINHIDTDDLIIVFPNTTHIMKNYNSCSFEYIAIKIDSMEQLRFNHNDNSFYILKCSHQRNTLLHFFQTILSTVHDPSHECDIVYQNMIEMISTILNRNTTLSPAIFSIPRKSCQLCKEVKQYIEQSYKENYTLEFLASHFDVSRYYLAHTFKKVYGFSPMSYLMTCRIEEAKLLLENKEVTVSSISHQLGFSSPCYFAKVFKNYTNLTPTEYRENILK